MNAVKDNSSDEPPGSPPSLYSNARCFLTTLAGMGQPAPERGDNPSDYSLLFIRRLGVSGRYPVP